MTGWSLFATAALLVVNGYFASLEFALVGSRPARIEAMAAEGNRRAKSAMYASSDLTMQLAGAQLGMTMASLGIGFFGEPAMAHLIESGLGNFVLIPERVAEVAGFVIGLGIIVFLHMIIGEIVPKNMALAAPERALSWLAPLARWYLRLFRPVVAVLNAAARGGIRLFKVEPRDELTSAHTPEELAVMLAESHEEGFIEEFAHDLLAGVLDFGGRTAAAVMVPRDEIVAVPRTATVAEVEATIVASGHSRVPVTDDDVDSVLGFAHSKDLLALPTALQDKALPLRLVRRMLIVPRDRPLQDLMLSMRRARVHLALVIEPNKATAGLLTLEDLLEELVGDILDESDRATSHGGAGLERGHEGGGT